MRAVFSFVVEREHRAELLKLGWTVPAEVSVEIDPHALPVALRADVMAMLRFDDQGRLLQRSYPAGSAPEHPAHDRRTLLLTLSRDAAVGRRQAGGPASEGSGLRVLDNPSATHLLGALRLLESAPLLGLFHTKELAALTHAHSLSFPAVVDVDARHLLVLQCQAAAPDTHALETQVLLDKIAGLTMREGEHLLSLLCRYRCSATDFTGGHRRLEGLCRELEAVA